MSFRVKVAKAGGWIAGIGAVVGYGLNRLALPAVDCAEGAYTLTCESIGDRLAFMAGNFGSVMAALLGALPGILIYAFASPPDEPPSQ